MGTVVNTASLVQYNSIHDPSLYVKKRLKDLCRSIMDHLKMSVNRNNNYT
jgi:hypothetical protein